MGDFKETHEPRRKGEAPGRRVRAGIREEEVCQLINLKKNLDYSDILIKYANKYLKLGWDLVAVNFPGEAALELDFQQPEEIWSPKLTALGLEGAQVNLGVRTGSPSRLLVLEVHRSESLPPFNQRGEWGSGCVAEVGGDREQHYYILPRGWQPPASYFLEAFQIMIFGEEGMVLAPPSLEPRVQANLRWLRPPWESPPTRPSPVLCKFLKESSPCLAEAALPASPQVLPWSEIYPRITAYPPVLQALLAPAATPEDYYQHLVAAARGVGLTDPQVMLGLLWHAPLGEGIALPRRREYFQQLVRQAGAGGPGTRLPERRASRRGAPGPLGPSGGEPEETSPPPGRGGALDGDFPTPPATAAPASVPEAPERRDEPLQGNGNGRRTSPEAEEEYIDSWGEFLRLSRDTLVVDRRRYEAMIYELGKLGAWQEVGKREHRENCRLREKIEARWNRELEFLRQLQVKTDKKGSRRW